jgi:hypothetical protein
MTYHNQQYLDACTQELGKELTTQETATALDTLAYEATKELKQIESLLFGGFLQDTPEDGLAWRVFNEVLAMKKERNRLRDAIRNLRDVNGRFHTQQATEQLLALLPESAAKNSN